MNAYESGLRAGGGCRIRHSDGAVQELPIERWLDSADSSDDLLLERCHGSTLDVGCGPGRLTASLADRGIRVLGIDVSTEAVRIARARGATVHLGDVFEEVPGAGDWEHVLLADGNIGIGGSPVRLLRRVRSLLAETGSVIVDVEPPGVGIRHTRMLVEAHGHAGWMRWAAVGVDAISTVADRAGLCVESGTDDGAGRHVVELRRS